jgi:hypothetical protein
MWDSMLSSGANFIIWEKMISSGANVIMVSSGANDIIWCYHVMLSSGMITHPFFIFPGNFTHSNNTDLHLIEREEKIRKLNVISIVAKMCGFLSTFKEPWLQRLRLPGRPEPR